MKEDGSGGEDMETKEYGKSCKQDLTPAFTLQPQSLAKTCLKVVPEMGFFCMDIYCIIATVTVLKGHIIISIDQTRCTHIGVEKTKGLRPLGLHPSSFLA